MEPGWIWCEDGLIVGMADDGVIVAFGECLLRKPSKTPGYPIIPMDAHTAEYLRTHGPAEW